MLWEQNEIQFLRDNYINSKSIPLIAKKMDRSVNSVRIKVYKEGLLKKTKTCNVNYKTALPQNQWHSMETFLIMIKNTKNLSRTLNKPAIIDLSELRKAYIAKEAGM